MVICVHQLATVRRRQTAKKMAIGIETKPKYGSLKIHYLSYARIRIAVVGLYGPKRNIELKKFLLENVFLNLKIILFIATEL